MMKRSPRAAPPIAARRFAAALPARRDAVLPASRGGAAASPLCRCRRTLYAPACRAMPRATR